VIGVDCGAQILVHQSLIMWASLICYTLHEIGSLMKGLVLEKISVNVEYYLGMFNFELNANHKILTK